MHIISDEEKARRKQVNESVIGTSAMEGLVLDASTQALMGRFERGELTREELSAAIDLHVELLRLELQQARLKSMQQNAA